MSEEEKDENFAFMWLKITNESIPLIKWDGLKSIFIIGILSLIIVLNVWFKGLIINYIVRFAPKDRPINEMMLLEQVPTLIAYITFSSMFVISLMYGQPLVKIFGPSSCGLFLFSQAAHNWVFALGGLFMSIFRLYCIKFQTRDKKTFARNIRIAEIITICLLCYSTYEGHMIYTANSLEFCRGHSREMTMVIKDHQNISEDKKFYGKMLTRANIGMAQIVVTAEMVIYGYIFWELYKANRKPGLGLSKEVIQTRKRKNVITLTGQTITFFMEIVVTILMQLLYTKSGIEFLEPSEMTAFLIVGSMIVTLTQIYTSPELRRFYF